MSDTRYAFTLPRPDGGALCLADCAGQVVLPVDTASECGFTPQYAGLERFRRAYRQRGYALPASPCDQSGHQDPGDGAQIARFCATRLGVTFPRSAKSPVKGADTLALHRFLTHAASDGLAADIEALPGEAVAPSRKPASPRRRATTVPAWSCAGSCGA